MKKEKEYDRRVRFICIKCEFKQIHQFLDDFMNEVLETECIQCKWPLFVKDIIINNWYNEYEETQFYTFKKTSKYFGCKGWIYPSNNPEGKVRMVITLLSEQLKTDIKTAINDSTRSKKEKEILLGELGINRAPKIKNIDKADLVKVKLAVDKSVDGIKKK